MIEYVKIKKLSLKELNSPTAEQGAEMKISSENSTQPKITLYFLD